MRTIHARISLILLGAFLFTTSVQAQFRGWSPQAKGTAIGVGVGGAAGAIINKRNRVVGGLIGGVAGGAAGYGIGKGIDNRRKTNARIAAAEREAAAARQEARLARQEAAVAARRSATVNQSTVARRSAVAPAAVGAAAGTGFGAAIAANSFSAQTVPGAYGSNALFMPNASYGDQATAYPSSEVRRKSW